jgi:bla regulator protein blaR1
MGAALQLSAVAQNVPASSPAFEVSTVKPSSPDARSSNLNLGSDLLRASNLPVLFLLQYAYNLNSGSTDQIVGAPSWISTMRFDLTAKMSNEGFAMIGAMKPDMRDAAQRRMMQELLADRFQLRVHHESRELAVLSLTVAKNGSKLAVVSQEPVVEPSKPRGPNDWSGLHNAEGLVEGRGASITMLINSLSWKPEVGGRLVVDETGLQGKYDFTLRWNPEYGDSSDSKSDGTGASLFTALQEQLGLKLVSKKSAVDCIVIDHVEQPTPN